MPSVALKDKSALQLSRVKGLCITSNRAAIDRAVILSLLRLNTELSRSTDIIITALKTDGVNSAIEEKTIIRGIAIMQTPLLGKRKSPSRVVIATSRKEVCIPETDVM